MPELQRRWAWTFIELVVVISIITILMAMLMPFLQSVHESSRQKVCLQNLKDLSLILHNYHHNHQGMPPYASGRENEIFGSWFVHLLPYSEYSVLHEKVQAKPPTSNRRGLRMAVTSVSRPDLAQVVFERMLCPSDPTRTETGQQGTTSYLANWYAFGDGTGGAFSPRQNFHNLTDGLSSVVLFAEAHAHCNGLPRLALISQYHHNFGLTQDDKPSDDPAYLPTDYTMFQVKPASCDKLRTQAAHDHMPVALADASVRWVSPTILPETWKSVLKPRDGLPQGGDW